MDNVKDKLDLNHLLMFVKSKTKLDLSRYRESTLKRRVSHRMVVLGCEDIHDYVSYIYKNHGELSFLTDTVTIHVTEFFRDRDVFEYFSRRIIGSISRGKAGTGDNTIRIWSAGCSTGEEPYSVAILLDDYLRNRDIEAEIYGTDISEEACRTADRGIYPPEKLTGVPARIKDRYFEESGEGLRICKAIKKMVTFDVHDLFSDPPFAGIDLVICRNVLIHFKHSCRQEVMTKFHSTLNDNGLLMLGKSEAVGGRALGMFKLIDPAIKIYKKIRPDDNLKEA